jgi:outer membrane protein assembly factor BamB
MKRMKTVLLPILFGALWASPGAAPAETPGIDWPQWRGPGRDGVWRESGLLRKFPAEFGAKWSVPVGSGYCGPTVAEGRVYVMDRLVTPREVERVHCFDWQNGRTIWTHEYPCTYERVSYKAGPRCTVLVADGRAYTLGAAGHLCCLDAASGDVLWSHDLDKTYGIAMPIWGIAASPLIEKNLLIVPVCGKEAYLVAFHAKTGKEVWRALRDRGNYSAPIVIEQAGRRVLVSWSGDRVVAVNPADGHLCWEVPFKPRNMPLGVPSPVLAGDKLFLTGFYDGSLMLELDQEKLAVRELWRRRGRNERNTDALHSTISTPVIIGEHIYGVDSYGELRCLRVSDGGRVWEDTSAVPRDRWATIHFVRNGGEVWMFNERGELILGTLSPDGFAELSRGKLIEPTVDQLKRGGKGVAWSHPAFAYRHVFIRNDKELRCIDLSAR